MTARAAGRTHAQLARRQIQIIIHNEQIVGFASIITQ